MKMTIYNRGNEKSTVVFEPWAKEVIVECGREIKVDFRDGDLEEIHIGNNAISLFSSGEHIPVVF